MKTKYRIESDGTPVGTKVFIDGKALGGIQSMKFEVSVDEPVGSLTLNLRTLPMGSDK